MTVAYVGLGGNIGSPAEVAARFDRVVEALRGWPDVRSVALSSLVASAPVGPVTAQDDFVNAVARVEVDDRMTAWGVLERLLRLERDTGRTRDPNAPAKGPRAIDLDLLVFGAQVRADDPRCIVPHPQLAARAFALVPLAELAGADFAIPGAGCTIGEALARPAVAAQRVWPVTPHS